MRFYSNGKLLLTGEYLVLNGALALALPTKFGQDLNLIQDKTNLIKWKSINRDGDIWFECELHKDNLNVIRTTSNQVSDIIQRILNTIREINNDFLKSTGSIITTNLSFDKEWGLGSSSTLIYNISKAANIDPFELNNKIFNGSGYDIACASEDSPILYQLIENKRKISKVNFNPPFKDNIYFVYLNKKQNSKKEVKKYSKVDFSRTAISEVSYISNKILTCQTLKDFNNLIFSHEKIISNLISRKTIKDTFFYDFDGEIKSLGAWGGDFILVSSLTNPTSYFKKKGFKTIFKFDDLIC